MTEPAASPALGKAKMSPALARAMTAAAAVVVLIIGYLAASATVPLLWAQFIGEQIGGQSANGILLAMFYGFTFSFVPLLIAWQARRRKLNKWVRVALGVAAVVLTLPNVLTLGVMYGGTQTAVQARAVWTIGAHWFGTWSQIFMLAGVMGAVAVIVLGRARSRRRRNVHQTLS